MATYIISGVLVLVCVVVIYRYIRNLRRGDSCCTTGEEPEKKIRVKDRDQSHYPYSARLSIDGMTCAACATRVENGINSLPGCWAVVDLATKSALVRCKEPVDTEALQKAVRVSGYLVLETSLL